MTLLNNYKLNLFLIIIFSYFIIHTNQSINKKKVKITQRYSKSSGGLTNPITIQKNTKQTIRDRKQNINIININENMINSICFKYCIKRLRDIKLRHSNNKLVCYNVCKNAIKNNLYIKSEMDKNIMDTISKNNNTNNNFIKIINNENNTNNDKNIFDLYLTTPKSVLSDDIKYYNLSDYTYFKFKEKCLDKSEVKINDDNITCSIQCDSIFGKNLILDYEGLKDSCKYILHYLFRWHGFASYNKYRLRMDELISLSTPNENNIKL